MRKTAAELKQKAFKKDLNRILKKHGLAIWPNGRAISYSVPYKIYGSTITTLIDDERGCDPVFEKGFKAVK